MNAKRQLEQVLRLRRDPCVDPRPQERQHDAPLHIVAMSKQRRPARCGRGLCVAPLCQQRRPQTRSNVPNRRRPLRLVGAQYTSVCFLGRHKCRFKPAQKIGVPVRHRDTPPRHLYSSTPQLTIFHSLDACTHTHTHSVLQPPRRCTIQYTSTVTFCLWFSLMIVYCTARVVSKSQHWVARTNHAPQQGHAGLDSFQNATAERTSV